MVLSVPMGVLKTVLSVPGSSVASPSSVQLLIEQPAGPRRSSARPGSLECGCARAASLASSLVPSCITAWASCMFRSRSSVDSSCRRLESSGPSSRIWRQARSSLAKDSRAAASSSTNSSLRPGPSARRMLDPAAMRTSSRSWPASLSALARRLCFSACSRVTCAASELRSASSRAGSRPRASNLTTVLGCLRGSWRLVTGSVWGHSRRFGVVSPSHAHKSCSSSLAASSLPNAASCAVRSAASCLTAWSAAATARPWAARSASASASPEESSSRRRCSSTTTSGGSPSRSGPRSVTLGPSAPLMQLSRASRAHVPGSWSASWWAISSWLFSSNASASARACISNVHSLRAWHSACSRCSSEWCRSARSWSCASAAASCSLRVLLAACSASTSPPAASGSPRASGRGRGGSTRTSSTASRDSSSAISRGPRRPFASVTTLPGRMARAGSRLFQSATRPAGLTLATSSDPGSNSMPSAPPELLSSTAKRGGAPPAARGSPSGRRPRP
mmetsp:Transcript_16210/g.47316  ORF Transcript_16210/g.47316 Transcript_16210/m.47316 type:complete len:506 (+) Transcript_16210:713-2230(+)